MKTINRLFALFLIIGLSPCHIFASESLNIDTTVKDRQVTFTQNNDNRVTVSVRNGDGTPVTGLTEEDFSITDGLKKIKILSVDPLHTDLDIPLNLVIIIDNSLSMKNRNAVTPLLNALDEYLKVIRPIDHVTAITFSKKTNMFYGKKLNLRTIGTTDVKQLKTFFEEGFSKNLTTRTYLYDAVSTGMDILKEIPESEHNILTIFTDGADNNSKATPEILLSKADNMDNFETYIIDYTEANNKDPFFSKLAEENTGNVWKADESSELIPIFKTISKLLLYKYVITYRYYFPPKGNISLNPDILNFDSIVFTDGTQIGNKLFFHNGKSEIPSYYEQYASHSDTLYFNPVVFPMYQPGIL